MNEAKAIREELAWIGRYQDGISPKLAKYQELEERKAVLRQQLKSLSDNKSGVDPEPMGKNNKWRPAHKDIVGVLDPKVEKAYMSVSSKKANNSYSL